MSPAAVDKSGAPKAAGSASSAPSLLLPLATSALPSPADNLMRIITPVRLSPELGDKLNADVAETRKILERFQKGGFEYAIWAVDKLPALPVPPELAHEGGSGVEGPEKETQLVKWTDQCLKAFPGKVIVALDGKLEAGKYAFDREMLRAFLNQALPRAAGCVVNFSSLDNSIAEAGCEQAIATVKQNIELVRSVSKKSSLWLYLNDDHSVRGTIPQWTKELGDMVDGYYVSHNHEWNAANDKACGEAAAALAALSKPVVRGGFRYTCPRVRPGIEGDLAENFSQRIGVYEKWIIDSKFAGYGREIGVFVPALVNANMNFLVANK